MAVTAFYGRITKSPSPVRVVRVIGMTTGLGSDRHTFSVTAATKLSVEDVRRGALPGLPTMHLHNPEFAYESGDFHQGVRMTGFRACRRHLHRIHRDRLSPQVHAANGRGAWWLPGAEMPCLSRTGHRQSVWKLVIHGRSES